MSPVCGNVAQGTKNGVDYVKYFQVSKTFGMLKVLAGAKISGEALPQNTGEPRDAEESSRSELLY